MQMGLQDQKKWKWWSAQVQGKLVVKDFTQEPGVNFFEAFTPVARIQTIRLVLFLAVQFKCHTTQFDIPNANVKAPVHEDIYMAQPEGFTTDDPTSVLKLIKALYVTKQAKRCLEPWIDWFPY